MNEELNKDLEEKSEPDYMQGFNSGYLIAEHEPGLSKKIVESFKSMDSGKSLYAEGLEEGILHHELEKAKERFKDYQIPDRGNTHDKERTKE